MGLAALIPVVGSIIDKIATSKEQARVMKQELARAQIDGELRQFEARFNAIMVEGGSSDKWTSRARPGFLYVVYLYLLAAIPMGILTVYSPESAGKVALGMQAWLHSIPEQMWWLFGAGYLGYVGGRSWDKRNILRGKD